MRGKGNLIKLTNSNMISNNGEGLVENRPWKSRIMGAGTNDKINDFWKQDD